jgi:hypothetical protein
MPAVGFIDAASYPVRNVFNYAPQGAKDIFRGLNPKYYRGYVGSNTDPFDPNFAIWINHCMKKNWEAMAHGTNPYVIGFSLGESDYIFGFGAGASADFRTIPPGGGDNNAHLGWIVLVTAPTQARNYVWNTTYTDTTVYAKQALKNFLQERYKTINALNAAWGSRYTKFDSAGGWGAGTALLDEDGRNAWVPRDWDNLRDATDALKRDLDDFLYLYAAQWFKTQRDAVKRNYPNKLYLGPNVIGSWGTPPRKQILQAAGQYLDVLMTQIGVGAPDDQQRLDFTMRYLGDKPIATWLGFPANPDSFMWRFPNPVTFLASKTQTERGQNYHRIVNWLFDATVSPNVSGVSRTKPFVGVRWWAWIDSGGERANWGLVTPFDNAYDGIESKSYGCAAGNPAACKACRDPWGYPCGAEEKDYGDFLEAVRNTNSAVIQRLLAESRPN